MNLTDSRTNRGFFFFFLVIKLPFLKKSCQGDIFEVYLKTLREKKNILQAIITFAQPDN